MKALLSLHRWLGVIACLAVLLFAGSGILHPLMSQLQPRPAQTQPPALAPPAHTVGLRAVLDRHGIENFSAASLAQLPQGAAYRVQTTDAVRYFEAASGTAIDNGERLHAQALARHFLGDAAAAIAHSEKIGEFDADYVFVNRLLPVWRVDIAREDGITLYVDTAGNRLATINDDPKRAFQRFFRALHDFQFLDDYPRARLSVMLVLLAAAFATAAMGLVLFVRLRGSRAALARQPMRRWHRRLALAVSLSTLGFAFSGALHLLHSQREIAPAAAPVPQFRSADIGAFTPMQPFTLAMLNGRPCYRVSAAAVAPADEHAHHSAPTQAQAPAVTAHCLDSGSGAPIANAETQLAEALARHYSRSTTPLESLEPVARFGGEYGFINKRLPVWRARFAGAATRWYVETASGALALRADDVDAWEGAVFSLLHKARFIGDSYRNLRDAALMVFAFGNIVVALLGLWLLLRFRFLPAPQSST